jgi:hypothetical protein
MNMKGGDCAWSCDSPKSWVDISDNRYEKCTWLRSCCCEPKDYSTAQASSTNIFSLLWEKLVSV